MAKVALDSGGARFQMSLAALGRGAKRETPVPASPEAKANRIDYRRGGLTEWYVNGPLGLEQGFTLDQPLENPRGEALTIALRLGGDLRAAPASEGMNLVRADGSTALHYRGLVAWDATGRTLPAWWQGEGAEVRLRVDDTAARYPVTIDPFIQQAKLTASDGTGGDNFGFSLAMSGDTVVVGAPNDDIAGNSGQGSAYVFVKPPTGAWMTTASFAAKLTASDGAPLGGLAGSVAVSGDTVVVGKGFGGQLGAYVFLKPVVGWTGTLYEDAKLTTSDGGINHPVAIDGDTVVAGPYVYVKPAGGWAGALAESAKLTASDQVLSLVLLLDAWVSLDADTVVLGVPTDEINGTAGRGSAYIFEKPFLGWAGSLTERAKLTASDSDFVRGFGSSVAVSDTQDVVAASWTGLVYVF
jgi:hypothetical protein